MIETGNLSEFNNARIRDISLCNDSDIVAILTENITLFPNIYFLLTETTKFYTENFSELLKCIKREKRLVVFETPSRVSMTHEYTIEGIGGLSQGFHFLFNTRERLSWLKIYLEEKRVSIASRTKIVSLLINILGSELDEIAKLLNSSMEDVALRLYEASDGKPCFVEFNQKEYKGQQSLLLSITFFDSIRNKVSQYRERWWSPLQEKQINYNYSTISGTANAWVYFKSPTNFVLSTKHNAKEGEFEVSPSNDDEINSLVLTPKGKKLSIDFNISIDVPNGLKTWYDTMLYISCVGIVCGVILLFYIMYTTNSVKLIETFNNCCYAIIAALIATRGWLMSEEQVMKKISNCYTYIIFILLALIVIISIVFHINKPLETTEESKIETLISIESIKYEIQNNITNADTTLNNVIKLEHSTYDSLQIKNQNKHQDTITTHKKKENINSKHDTIVKNRTKVKSK